MASIIGELSSALSSPAIDDSLLRPEEIRGKTVCTYSGYLLNLRRYGPIFEPVGGLEDMSLCMDALRAGTVDAVAYDKYHVNAIIKQDSTLQKFDVGESFTTWWQGAFVSGRSEHEDVKTRDALNWGIGKVLANHAMTEDLHNQWLSSHGLGKHDVDEVDPALSGLCLCAWGLFLFLQILGMNNPWIEHLRECFPECALTRFIWGTEEERQTFRRYNATAKDKWYEAFPKWCMPTPRDDNGMFTVTAQQGWRGAASGQLKAAALSEVAARREATENCVADPVQEIRQSSSDAKVHPDIHDAGRRSTDSVRSSCPKRQDPIEPFSKNSETTDGR